MASYSSGEEDRQVCLVGCSGLLRREGSSPSGANVTGNSVEVSAAVSKTEGEGSSPSSPAKL